MAAFITLSCVFGMSLIQKTKASEPIEESSFENETIEEIYEPHGNIDIQGIATIEVGPDLLVIILKISALDKDSADSATDKVATKLNKVISSLEELGISKEDIGSTSYTINQKYEWTYYENGNRKERVFKGYEAVNTLRVEIKDFDKGGKVIDAASNAGALVNSINFELSKEKRNNLKIQAMEKASKDAKLKAETIVSTLDEELGHVTSIDLNNYNYKPHVYWDRVGFSAKSEPASNTPPTVILPTDLTVSVNVNVVWDLI